MTEQPRTSRVSIAWIMIVVLVLPMLYVLSIGPAEKLQRAGWLGSHEGPLVQFLVVFYRPLAVCLEADIPVLKEGLERYVQLWID